MSGPFVFVGTHRIREGQVEAFKQDARELVQIVQKQEPQLLSFNFFLNEEETEVTVVQVHPDADSMLTHMQVAHEHITDAAENRLDNKDIQIYGPSNEAVTGMIAQLSQAGVPIAAKPVHLGGFTR